MGKKSKQQQPQVDLIAIAERAYSLKVQIEELTKQRAELTETLRAAPQGTYGRVQVVHSPRSVLNLDRAFKKYGKKVQETITTLAAVKRLGLAEDKLKELYDPGTTAVTLKFVEGE